MQQSRAVGTGPYYSTPYEQYGQSYPGKTQIQTNEVKGLFVQKKGDILGSIIAKIIDKLVAAIPTVLSKLFGETFTGLMKYDQYGVQNILNNFGVIGYVPLILLKLINGIEYFIRVLKQNKFFKNFLLPALIVLLVSGSVIFLIWWLQGDDVGVNYRQIGYENSGDQAKYPYDQYSKSMSPYYTGNYGYRDASSVPQYSRSYYVNKR